MATLPSTGLELSLSASSIGGLSHGDDVTQWDDESGNARHATQEGVISLPTYYVSNEGYPFVWFENQVLSGTGLPLSGDQALTVACVAFGVSLTTSDGGFNRPVWYLGEDSGQSDRSVVCFSLDRDENNILLIGGNAKFPDEISRRRYNSFIHRYQGGGVIFEAWRNGTKQTADSSATGALNLGSGKYVLSYAPNNGNRGSVLMGELHVWSRDLSDAEIDDVQEVMEERVPLLTQFPRLRVMTWEPTA